MSLWNRLFNKKDNTEKAPQFQTHFGRFTDAYKTADQYAAWDQAVAHFDKRDYNKALDSFILYIQNSGKPNIQREPQKESGFKILQGSKTIEVKIKNGHLQVFSAVAKAEQLHIGFMRRLLDLNYELKYVRYGLSDDQVITLLFDTTLENASPYKLYFGLKELAIHADKQDDLLVDEFDFLKPIQSGQVEILTSQEQVHKLGFIKESIHRAIHLLDHGKLKLEQYPAANGYILLALLYKLDYLIRPEGALMDKIEQIHKTYFSQDNKNLLQKLKTIRQDLSKIEQLKHEDIFKDLYTSTFTFGITSPANTAMIFEVLDREFQNIQWYLDNQHSEYVIAIIEYAAGICLFNYAVPLPIKELFTMIYRVTEPTYFVPIFGFDHLVDTDGLPDKAVIRKALQVIEKKYQKEYPHLVLDSHALRYDQISSFAHSLIKMVRLLHLNKTS